MCCTTGAGYLENCFASVVLVIIFRDRTFNQPVKKKKKKRKKKIKRKNQTKRKKKEKEKTGLGGRMKLSGESRRVHAVLRRLM